MKTNEEKLAIYKAFLEGKEIEVKDVGEGNKLMTPNSMPVFDYGLFDYRIKPDIVKIRTMTVAKAYKREDGMIIWVVGESLLVHKYYQRLPEFDLVANQ